MTWTNELLTITASEPAGPVAVHPSTVVGWRDGATHRRARRRGRAGRSRWDVATVSTPGPVAVEPVVDAVRRRRHRWPT